MLIIIIFIIVQNQLRQAMIPVQLSRELDEVVGTLHVPAAWRRRGPRPRQPCLGDFSAMSRTLTVHNTAAQPATVHVYVVDGDELVSQTTRVMAPGQQDVLTLAPRPGETGAFVIALPPQCARPARCIELINCDVLAGRMEVAFPLGWGAKCPLDLVHGDTVRRCACRPSFDSRDLSPMRI